MKNLPVILLVLMMVSCSFEKKDLISGNGKIKSKVLSTDTITRVVVSDKLDVVLIPSDSVYAILVADENLHEHIVAEVSGHIMSVNCKKRIRMAKVKEIRIYGNYLERADISMRSSFDNRDSVVRDNFILRATSGSNARLTGRFQNLEIFSASGSNVNIAGYADYLNANVNSAADLYGYDLEARTADIVSSSAADVRVTVKEEAQFNATSAADIIYKGNPNVINSKSNSFGDIKKSKH